MGHGTIQLDGTLVCFATPRKLPKAKLLGARVVVLDIAFASEGGGSANAFERTTLRFIDELGPRLALWVDHHDSEHHRRFAGDARFVLARKAEHGACPEMLTPEMVAAVGPIDTIVCHTDFDGLASAAKWLLGGREPYPGADEDARAIDTRTGLPSETAARIDRALRARSRDAALEAAVVRELVSGLTDEAAWAIIDAAGAELVPREAEARRLAAGYRRLGDDVVLVDVSGNATPYDRTLLLLLGQEAAKIAAVVDGDNVTFAAPFDSGVNFLERFGLSGGMPTMVSLHKSKLEGALKRLNAGG
jgi:hypothetical protein